MRKIINLGLIIILLFTWVQPVFSEIPVAEYLCELGVSFYRMGRFDDALLEFKKALLIDPQNKTAIGYINNIFKQELKAPVTEIKPTLSQKAPSREEVMDTALDNLTTKEELQKKLQEETKPGVEIAGIKIRGNIQASLGITAQDTIWKQADFGLNEENSRIFSERAFNRKTNTFDTRIYDRLKVLLDTDNESGFNFHSDITVDPWSFTGKSSKFSVVSAFNDVAEIELKYWSNTGYLKDETVYTKRSGNSITIPEIKVNDGRTDQFITLGAFWPNDTFIIPSQKIIRQFQPIRELYFDYAKDGTKTRFFPLGLEDQALTFDDPLVLSNNHIFWQQSPWLDQWKSGIINNAGADFTRGRFDDALSYSTRDSDGTRLTALRGFSFRHEPDGALSLLSTFASPKNLWQEYDSFDNIINATRFKYRLLDKLGLGGLFTYRLGLNEEEEVDTTNYLWGTDLGYEPIEGTKITLEGATSRSVKDITTHDYLTRSRGFAYHFSLFGTFPRKSIMDLAYGYDEIKPLKEDTYFFKYKLYAAHMDRGFYPALSNYRETRDDTFWGRHIHFRKPFQYYLTGLYKPALTWDDIANYRIGNGIDIGRDAVGFRLESSLFDQSFDNLVDVRNVHDTDGRFIENVVRDEVSFKATEKLTTKALGIYQQLPKTTQGRDPFIFYNRDDIFLINDSIEGGKDPSLKTGSLGLEYAFTDRLSLSGIWERTNDYTLAYDNFPRGNLNGSSLGRIFSEYDKTFRAEDPFLYSQGLFPLPPYPFYDIWKAGLRIEPLENLELYLDYTRNEFKSAGYIDDNLNHIGLELSYMPTKKFGCFFKYTFSRWNDINRMVAGYDKIYLSHHNFFGEFRYFPTQDDELALQYGESGIGLLTSATFDPFGGSLATLDTRHIIRMYYRRKF